MPTGRFPSTRIFLVFTLLMGLTSCAPRTAVPQPVAQTQTSIPVPSTTPSPPSAEITFKVSLLQKPPSSQKIYVDLLDEVTGLALHPDRHELKAQDSQHYSAAISIPIGSVIKYRYTRDGKPAPVEYNCIGQQVRYRMFLVGGSDTVPDVICAWNDQAVETAHGRILGTVVDAKSRRPLPDILVSAAGASTLTSSDGSFLLENLPPGTHNLIAYSLDGRYQTYQQGAVVAVEAATPAPIELTAAPLVNVEFQVKTPGMSAPNLPLRIIGNILSLGNTFSDLSGGISAVGYRAPLLKFQAGGSYSIKMLLPAGLDLRYKYTLGDGFWNGELDKTGGFYTRQIVIPSHDVVVNDVIAAWQPPNSAPITFTVKVPDNTPANDTVSIQFNPFGWTEPIPMWAMGQNTWYYILYNPQNLMPSAHYRYCRNEQCGIADSANTAGPKAAGLVFKPGASPQTIRDEVKNWAGLDPLKALPAEKPEITRSGLFWTGVEIQPNYDPTWQNHFSSAFESIRSLNAGWVILSPSWQYTSTNPPVLEAVAGRTPTSAEMTATITQAKQNRLHVALYPQVTGAVTSAKMWEQARLDSDWWQRWFERYRIFVLNYAELAQSNGVEALILDGEIGRPAFPGTTLINGVPNNLPVDAADHWQALIKEVRDRFHGQLLWTVRYSGRLAALPDFANQFDQIYLLWSAPLTIKKGTGEKDLTHNFVNAMRRDILPVKNMINKPILLGLGYPSVQGAVTGCLKVGQTCLPFDSYNQPFTPGKQFQADFTEQATIYRAILKGINREEFNWISGLVTRGYYPAAALQDLSLSVHGKLAEQTLTEWFAAFREHEQ